MIVRCEVLAVETTGDKLRIYMQGVADGEAEWLPMGAMQVDVADIERNKKSFWVGRKVDVEIKPR